MKNTILNGAIGVIGICGMLGVGMLLFDSGRPVLPGSNHEMESGDQVRQVIPVSEEVIPSPRTVVLEPGTTGYEEQKNISDSKETMTDDIDYLSENLTPYQRYLAGLKLNRLGKPEDAEKAFTMVIAAAPKFSKAYVNRARCYLALGLYDSAINDCTSALQLKADDGVVHNVMGLVLEKKGLVDEAKLNYEKAIELSPDYAWTYNNLGLMLFKHGDLENAYRNLRKATDIDNSQACFHNNLGQVYEHLGQFTRARRSYEQAVTVAGVNSRASDSLARIRESKDLNGDLVFSLENEVDDTALTEAVLTTEITVTNDAPAQN